LTWWSVLKERSRDECPKCKSQLRHGECGMCGWKRPLKGTASGRDLNSLRALMPEGGPIMNCPKCGSDSILELPIGSGNLGCISCGAQQYGEEWVE